MKLAVAASAALVFAAPAAAAPPIVGGTPATDGDYPSVVVLQAYTALCTGELIDPEWVMTAAHCLDPAVLMLESQAQVTQMTVVLAGTVDASKRQGAKQLLASATYIDPAWDHTRFGKHDLGLIHLGGEYTMDGSGHPVTPLPIEFDSAEAPVGVTVTMVGFGTTSGGAGAKAGIEYALGGQVSVPCSDFKVGSGATIEDADLLCFSQTSGQGTCEGDSGGPLIATIDGTTKVVGTTSFGDNDCTEYGAYTRLSQEGDFIRAHIPALCGGSAGSGCTDPHAPTGDGGGCDGGGGGGGATWLLLAAGARRRASRRAGRAGAGRSASSRAS